MLQTCEITLTPNTDGSYQEVKSCQLSAIGSSSASSGSGAAAAPAADPIVVIVSGHFRWFGPVTTVCYIWDSMRPALLPRGCFL